MDHGSIWTFLAAVVALAGKLVLHHLDRREARQDAAEKAEQERKIIRELEETIREDNKRESHHTGKHH